MDSSTFKAIHKYGAMLSVVGIALAVLAYVVGGPIGTTALLFFGWAGALGLFYFLLTSSKIVLSINSMMVNGSKQE